MIVSGVRLGGISRPCRSLSQPVSTMVLSVVLFSSIFHEGRDAFVTPWAEMPATKELFQGKDALDTPRSGMNAPRGYGPDFRGEPTLRP